MTGNDINEDHELSSESEGFEVEALTLAVGSMESDSDVSVSVTETKLQEFMEEQRSYGGESTAPLPPVEVPDNLPINLPHAYPCASSFSRLPEPPVRWPQAPVMLRPTPGSHTKIRGIRYSNQKVYQNFKGFCAGCILPVNTGKEKPGQSLVIDFETPLFVGTLLMRIKNVSPIMDTADYQEDSYFDGKKRRFQAIVKGKFKKEISMSDCITGQAFERPAGALPARFIVNSVIRFVSALAPQLQATLQGDRPRFTTPLVATAHTVIAKNHDSAVCESTDPLDESLRNYCLYEGSEDIEGSVQEPPASDATSVLQAVEDDSHQFASSVQSRMKYRKKVFNRIAANDQKEIKFDTTKEYTFEFYQHLLVFTDFDDIKLDLGRALGQVGLANPLNGQPIQFMAAQKDDDKLTPLWSFDIWHQSLYSLAKQQ